MANADSSGDAVSAEMISESVPRGIPSSFEKLITDQPPVLRSLIGQLPTQSILALFHTSSYLRNFLTRSPTSWRYISWRLYQPALTTATPTNNASGTGPRQSSNYALDLLIIHVINPFSTRLASLELDNTAVSGATLHTVLVLRKDTLEHVSVRGCKNVSLKYHINPWLVMHAMALDRPQDARAPGYEKLALKSLYTYRCRHHRRRPYLPSSLARKESDSEPTHELVLTCHRLGIWTDTAWCTTPGARCFRRRGYVTMRVPQDPREVWVVYDRLWRSRNWLGPIPENRSQTTPAVVTRKRKQDCRSWEFDEEAMNGESIAVNGEDKTIPAHLRLSHKKFVEDVYCDNCSDPILERCEQCSVMMHCSGCRKTLCGSCAFDRPYLRNKLALDEDKNKFWWAPGCAISPCSMQDQDPTPPGAPGNVPPIQQPNNTLPSIKFRWCCTEPVFSGGGGITFGNGQGRDTDRIRAAPLKSGQGWEDPEFSQHPECSSDTAHPDVFGQVGVPLSKADGLPGPGGRWPSIDSLFRRDPVMGFEQTVSTVPRILCDECHQSDQWKIKCKACSIALCLKHDVRDRLKVRICGYKDLVVEKAEFRSRQKALKLLTILMMKRRKGKMRASDNDSTSNHGKASSISLPEMHTTSFLEDDPRDESDAGLQTPRPRRTPRIPTMTETPDLRIIQTPTSDLDLQNRPISPGSNSTGPPSRSSSPTPSARSIPVTPEPSNTSQRNTRSDDEQPAWRGCQSFFCPASRTPGDHRRRCTAAMRQCTDCKVYVCEQCTQGLEPACPCKGCRVTSADETAAEAAPTDATLRFFCPNCRWSRMKTGKCKRKPVASSAGKNNSKKKSKTRRRKPVEERRGHQRSGPSTAIEASSSDIAEGLAEFFERLDVEDPAYQVFSQVHAENVSNIPAPGEEIRELEDMGALARDLIRRIQTLRQQFGPGSLAALALPDIRMDESGNVQQLVPAEPVPEPTQPQVPLAQQMQGHIEIDDDAQGSSSGSGI